MLRPIEDGEHLKEFVEHLKRVVEAIVGTTTTTTIE